MGRARRVADGARRPGAGGTAREGRGAGRPGASGPPAFTRTFHAGAPAGHGGGQRGAGEKMKIIVLVKQVPDTTDVKLDPKTGTLIREGVPSIINPDDKHAIEAALALKDQQGGSVSVLSMGPPQAEDALREALAMGADEAILLSDRAFAGADTLATSYTLAMGVKNVGDYDLVLAGRQAIDGDTAQIGPQVAEFLDLPQVTYVRDIKLGEGGKSLVVEKAMEDGYEVIETPLPALLTCIGDLNSPRYPTIKGIVAACRDCDIKVWGASDLGVSADAVGLNGSPTNVKRSFAPEPKGDCRMIEGDMAAQVDGLISALRGDNVIK